MTFKYMPFVFFVMENTFQSLLGHCKKDYVLFVVRLLLHGCKITNARDKTNRRNRIRIRTYSFRIIDLPVSERLTFN